MEEQWKRWIDPSFGKTNYEVSTEGRVRRIIDGKIMHTVINSSGYELVHLTYATGREKMIAVHKMVAYTFLEGEGDEVDHIDKDRRNNKITNLRWATREENMSNVEHTPRQAVSQYTLDGRHVATYADSKKAGRAVGLTNGAGIRAVCRGWQKTAGGYLWAFASLPEQLNLF